MDSKTMDFQIDRNYTRKLVADIASLIVLGLPLLLLNTIATPYRRGFYCDDTSIRYPYKDSTIPNGLLYFYGFSIPLVFVIGIELFNSRANLRTDLEKKTLLWKVYCELVPFFFGVLVSQLITDTAKVSIGRLRPHFLAVCNPSIPCLANAFNYMENFRCMSRDTDRIEDARKSFMSGHSSFSAFCMTFTVFFIQHKVDKQLGLIRKLVQFLLLYLAIYTGFTRISDYKHHWSDVLIGWLQGTVVAILICIYVAKLHRKRDQDRFYRPWLSLPTTLPTTVNGEITNSAA